MPVITPCVVHSMFGGYNDHCQGCKDATSDTEREVAMHPATLQRLLTLERWQREARGQLIASIAPDLHIDVDTVLRLVKEAPLDEAGSDAEP